MGADKVGIGGEIGLAVVVDLLQEAGRAKQAGQAENSPQGQEENERREDREGDLGGRTVEAHDREVEAASLPLVDPA